MKGFRVLFWLAVNLAWRILTAALLPAQLHRSIYKHVVEQLLQE
jgi:hypothetical protein